jgi:hypothetical protein
MIDFGKVTEPKIFFERVVSVALAVQSCRALISAPRTQIISAACSSLFATATAHTIVPPDAIADKTSTSRDYRLAG